MDTARTARDSGSGEDDSRKSVTRMCPRCSMELPPSVNVCPNDGYLFSPDSELKALREDLEFLEVIGSGANGLIYKVRHPLLDKVVAVKMLHSHLVSDQAVMRFHREAKAASNLSHPNIIVIHDFGVSKHGQPYMIMDFVEGQTLAARIDKQGPMPVGYAIPICTQICDALQHAHDKGVLHRDIKPNNMMLTDLDREIPTLKILDFGLAKVIHPDGKESKHLTRTGETVGSPLYMSPEQCQGVDLDRRSDIYSLGCVIYECLTGSPPHVGDTAITTMFKHLNDQAPSLKEGSLGVDFGEELEEIVATMLAKEPDDRFQTMREVKQALLAYYQGSTKPAIPGRAKPRTVDPQSFEPTEELKIVKKQKIFTITSVQIGLLGMAILVSFGVGLTIPHILRKPDPPPESKPIRQTFTEEIRLPENPAVDHVEDDELDKHTRKNPFLKEYTLRGEDISDKGAMYLGRLKRLQTLDLSNTKITDEGLKGLSNLSNLIILNIGQNSITDAGLQYLPPNLISLNLENTQVTDRGLKQLQNLKSLQQLILKSNQQIADKSIDALVPLKTLFDLDLEGTGITDDCFPKLQKMPWLRALHVGRTKLSGRNLALLKDLNQLQANDMTLSDNFIDKLVTMKGLQQVDLSRTNLTDENFLKLSKLKNLFIVLIERTMVSPSAIEKFKAARPNVHVCETREDFYKLLGVKPTKYVP